MQITSTNFSDLLVQYGISDYTATTQTAMQAWMLNKYLERGAIITGYSPSNSVSAFLIFSEDDNSSDYWKVQILKVNNLTESVTQEYGYTVKKSSYRDCKETLFDLLSTLS